MTELGNSVQSLQAAVSGQVWVVGLGEHMARNNNDTVDQGENDDQRPVKLRLEVKRSQLSRAHRVDSRISWTMALNNVAQISTLQSLTISAFFSFSGRHALPLCLLTSLLSQATSLEEFRLDQVGLQVDNDNGDDSCRDAFAALQKACASLVSLRRLSLARLYFPKQKSCQPLCAMTTSEDARGSSNSHTSLLMAAFVSCPRLVSFSVEATTRYFARPDVASQTVVAILGHPTIRSLYLGNLNLVEGSQEDTNTISTAWMSNGSLQSLCLTSCCLGGSLLSGLCSNSSLKVLDLMDSNLVQEFQTFSLALAQNTSLEKMILSHVRLGTTELSSHENLQLLLRACLGHARLTKLDLRGLYDYHYDDDITRPVELFHETLEAVLMLLKKSQALKAVYLDDLGGGEPQLSQPLAAISFYQKLNQSGLRTACTASAMEDFVKGLSLDRKELGYLFSIVRSNPMLYAEWNASTSTEL